VRETEALSAEALKPREVVSEVRERVEPETKVRIDRAAAIAEQLQIWAAIGNPPVEANRQPDGTFLLELEDKSTVRWTQRPNGSWRKPEHKKAGFVGELEQEKYTMPLERSLSDVDYHRGQSYMQRGVVVAKPPMPAPKFNFVDDDFPDLASCPVGRKSGAKTK
jgi:hypothetical protein